MGRTLCFYLVDLPEVVSVGEEPWRLCLLVLPVSGIGGDSEVILSKKQNVVMLACVKECRPLWAPDVG